MRLKMLALVAALLVLPSCTFVRDNFCVGNDAVKEVTADALSFVPVVGPMAGSITDIAFDILCTIVGLPAQMGEEVEGTIGVSLDPTAPEATVETSDDPGS